MHNDIIQCIVSLGTKFSNRLSAVENKPNRHDTIIIDLCEKVSVIAHNLDHWKIGMENSVLAEVAQDDILSFVANYPNALFKAEDMYAFRLG